MSDRNRAAGQFIDGRCRTLAKAIVGRQYKLHPELRRRYGKSGKEKCVDDTAYHLSYLAAALTFSSPALFTDYIAWAKSVMAAYGVASEHVEQNLTSLQEVLNEKLPDGMQGVANPYIEAAFAALPHAPTVPDSFLNGEDELTRLARNYLQSLLQTRRDHANRLLIEAVGSGVSVADIYLQVFQRCQREIGRLWQLRQITVAQEHYCTAATQLAMSQLYPFLFSLPKNGLRLVASCAGSELHEVGLRIIADLFEAEGWDTVYLGANVPVESLLQTIDQQRPDILLISTTMTFHLTEVARLIQLARTSAAGQTLKIIVGGYPFRVDPELWRQVGADGYAPEADDAVASAHRLLNLPEPARQRHIATDISVVASPQDQSTQTQNKDLYNELSSLNNKLLTMQRELARKNAQLERLNEKLVDADRRKDEFLAVLAHEMRNPLAPLRNAAEILQRSELDRQSIEDTGEMMEHQVDQLGRLIDDLLDITRIARGKMRLRKEPVDLKQAVHRAINVCRSLIDARQHTLSVSLPSSPLSLLADPLRLEQVLVNLLNNAARYTPEKGRIWLTVEQEGSEAVLRVGDTGIGIPQDMLSLVFGLFSQIDRERESREGGLGIGLSLVKSLTEMHGGSVEAQSDGQNRGSEFTVRWPIAPEQIAETPDGFGIDSPARQPALRILLVDKHVDAAVSLAMLLRLCGHETTVAHHGRDALVFADENHFEVVLIDVGLPEIDGYELARRLRSVPNMKESLLIALTSGNENEHDRSKKANFNHFLAKPVDLSALRTTLAQASSQQLQTMISKGAG